MKPILTLTLNPTIDGASEADVVRPIHKVRTRNERFDPGGGGINVARVVTEVGGAAFALSHAGCAHGPGLRRAKHAQYLEELGSDRDGGGFLYSAGL